MARKRKENKPFDGNEGPQGPEDYESYESPVPEFELLPLEKAKQEYEAIQEAMREKKEAVRNLAMIGAGVTVNEALVNILGLEPIDDDRGNQMLNLTNLDSII